MLGLVGPGQVRASHKGYGSSNREGVVRMSDQGAAQLARLAAREARARVRAERAEREKRLARAGEKVAVELARRDAAVAEHELRAGEALRLMVEDEGLSVRDALAWCGVAGLSSRQALRMMRQLQTGGMNRGGVEARDGNSMTPREGP